MMPTAFPYLIRLRSARQKLLIIGWIILLSSLFKEAHASPTINPIATGKNEVASTHLPRKGLSTISPEVDDQQIVSKRDLSPDILATSVPVPGFAHNAASRPQPESKGFLLRSSSTNVSGIGGYPIFALPILATELSDLLQAAQKDVQKQRGDVLTSSYQVNTSAWSFSVSTANTTLHYNTIAAVISRFLKFSSMRATPNDIASTRVGVLLNGDTPVADIQIMPCRVVKNSSYVPFQNFDQNRNISFAKPIEVVKVTPFGSSCAYESINISTALAPFVHQEAGNNLESRSIESEVFAQIGKTVFSMAIRLVARPDGMPVEVKIWAVQAVVTIAFMQVVGALLLATLELSFSSSGGVDAEQFLNDLGLDTGFYVVGRLMARFVVKIVKTAASGETFTLGFWKDLLMTLLTPLQEMGAYDNGWGMEGEVYGPANGTKASDGIRTGEISEKEVIAQWQIWIGDFDDFDE